MNKFTIYINMFAGLVWGYNSVSYVRGAEYGFFGLALALTIMHIFIAYNEYTKGVAS